VPAPSLLLLPPSLLIVLLLLVASRVLPVATVLLTELSVTLPAAGVLAVSLHWPSAASMAGASVCGSAVRGSRPQGAATAAAAASAGAAGAGAGAAICCIRQGAVCCPRGVPGSW
jgi:hypothetical protein